MESSRNGSWIIPFKKFNRLRVKIVILTYNVHHLETFSNFIHICMLRCIYNIVLHILLVLYKPLIVIRNILSIWYQSEYEIKKYFNVTSSFVILFVLGFTMISTSFFGVISDLAVIPPKCLSSWITIFCSFGVVWWFQHLYWSYLDRQST